MPDGVTLNTDAFAEAIDALTKKAMGQWSFLKAYQQCYMQRCGACHVFQRFRFVKVYPDSIIHEYYSVETLPVKF